uniref:Uncharacterized protein n=1 Tax=Aegilops tauschii subsp. strangulata TaxID=200361 RepID=A0A452YP10_AEGTS
FLNQLVHKIIRQRTTASQTTKQVVSSQASRPYIHRSSPPSLAVKSSTNHTRTDQDTSNGRRRKRRSEAAGHVGEPVRPSSQARAQPQGRRLRVCRRGPQEQERAAPQVQPRAPEGAGADPRRQAHLRVVGHPAIHRRGFRRRRLLAPPGGTPRPRRCSLLGRLHRRHGIIYISHRLIRFV